MLPSSGHKSISRIDSEKNNTFGWYVRVVFRGEMHSKFFSDAKFGSLEKALAQAIRHRNRVEREMGKPRTDRLVVAAKVATTAASATSSRTGIAGVQRITKGGHEAFQVTWSPAPNVVSRTSVSIAKYGEEDAFRRACRLRKKQELALYGKIMASTLPPHDINHESQPLTNLSKAKTPKARTPKARTLEKTASNAATTDVAPTSSTRSIARSDAQATVKSRAKTKRQ